MSPAINDAHADLAAFGMRLISDPRRIGCDNVVHEVDWQVASDDCIVPSTRLISPDDIAATADD
jgi:hypothetical protein